MKKVFITIPVGQSFRDFLILGGIKNLLTSSQGKVEIYLLTPAHNVPEFQAYCQEFNNLYLLRTECPVGCGNNTRLVNLRKRIKNRLLRQTLLKLEARNYQPPAYLVDAFSEHQPDLVVLTHPMTSHDYPVFMLSKQFKLKTISVVKSWDNLRKGLMCIADKISVWNDINLREAVDFNGYKKGDITINGAICFDPFFKSSSMSKNHQFLREQFGIPEGKKIITLATAGVYHMEYYGRDESHLAKDILRMINKNPALGNCHLIIRVHPMSKIEEFISIESENDNVSLSYGNYMPNIGWFTGDHDYKVQIELLKNSDVIVTPCSSWSIESAIFDTPVIAPIYSELQPEHAAAQFDRFTLKNHFRLIKDKKWIPLTTTLADTEKEIEAAFTNPSKYKQQRKDLVNNYMHYTDGRSVERITKWILACMDE